MFLDRIVASKQQEVDQLKQHFSLRQMEKQISGLPDCLGFRRALRDRRLPHMGLIAEVKKASPSKGLIREPFHPVDIARIYEESGADCISVLTDKPFFQGSNEYLQQVREAVNIPLLRKDFTIDYRQVYEARAIGADAILLIAAILTDAQLREYASIARSLGLDSLVEVHDRRELERALELDADLIGINNRNLRTFETDLKTTEELVCHIPRDRTTISESGISSPQEIAMLASVGVEAVLVGEHFMRQPDIGQAVSGLLGAAAAEGNRHG